MRSQLKISFFTCFIIFNYSLLAQQGLKWEAGLNISAYTYQGDLTPTRLGSTATPGFGFSLFANRIITPSLTMRTSFSYGRLRANDAAYTKPEWRQQRSFSFTTPLVEISETAVWNIFGNNRSLSKLPVMPYLTGGIGLSFLRINRDASKFNAEYFAESQWVAEGLAEDMNHTPPKSLIVFPVGAGLRFPLSNSLSLQTEASYRFTTTDYLDGFSKSAGPGKKDRYTSYSVGLTYSFGRRGNIICPPIPK